MDYKKVLENQIQTLEKASKGVTEDRFGSNRSEELCKISSTIVELIKTIDCIPEQHN